MVLRVALGLLILLTLASPVLAQEITGTWRYRNVTAIANNGTFCGGGTVTFSGTGVVTAGTFQDCDTTLLPATITGLVSNDGNGHVTGRVGLYDINASVLPDGNTMVAVTELIGDATGVGLAVFIRDTTTTFGQGDLTGTWRLHLIDGGELPNTITEDGFGTIDVAVNGTTTGGFLTVFGEPEGFTFRSITGGNVNVSSEGVLSGTVLSHHHDGCRQHQHPDHIGPAESDDLELRGQRAGARRYHRQRDGDRDGSVGRAGVGSITTSPVVFTGGNTSQDTQFNPAVVGSSVIAVGVPTGFDTPSNFRQISVTVNP